MISKSRIHEKDTHDLKKEINHLRPGPAGPHSEAIALRFYTQPLTPKRQLRSVDVRVRLTVD